MPETIAKMIVTNEMRKMTQITMSNIQGSRAPLRIGGIKPENDAGLIKELMFTSFMDTHEIFISLMSYNG